MPHLYPPRRPGRARPRPAGAILGPLLSIALLACPVRATVIAPTPGQQVELIEEKVVLVFDPLNASQTIVVQHEFAGTASPFGIIIPVPDTARVRTHSQRLRRALQRRLWPRGRVQRTLSVDLTSWATGCAVRDVGDGIPVEGEKSGGGSGRVRASTNSLGSAPEPLHDWLLEKGFTVAPAQAAWLNELRASGWNLVGVTVEPPAVRGTPDARLRGPVLSITHSTDEPVFAARHPPFALFDEGRSAGPALEIAVLTEWPVAVDIDRAPKPFYANTLTEKAVNRLSSDAGGLPWTFRREGALTGFQIERPTTGLGAIRFVRADPWPTTVPRAAPRIRANTLHVPIELVLFGALLAWLGWRRKDRRSLKRGGQRLS